MDTKQNQCDIIIPVFNQLDLTKACLDSIKNNTGIPYGLILVDNASNEETARYLEECKALNKNIQLVRNENNTGWVKAINQGMRLSKSPYVCIMNNDTVVRTKGWLSRLIDISKMAPDIGLVNPCFETKSNITSEKPFIEIDFCRGYCILIKREVIEKIGVLDERYGMGYYDDDDYSVRAIRAGFRCVRANDVVVEHKRDSTFSEIFGDKDRHELHEKNKELFYSKWGRRRNIVFIITKRFNKEAVSGALFAAARKQHIVNVWRANGPLLNLEHINIRERIFPNIFNSLLFTLALYVNRMKKKSKRYERIFVDDAKLNDMLAKAGFDTRYADMEKDIWTAI